jgi:hypothetical protein
LKVSGERYTLKLDLVSTANSFIKNIREVSGAYFYVFCDSCTDVKYPCFVYYVWRNGRGVRGATALIPICIMCWEDRTLAQHLKLIEFTVSLFRILVCIIQS